MKVRSWRILVTTVLACGIMLAYAVHEMGQGEWVGYAWCVLGIAWLVQGFKVAFSQEKCEEQERVASLERQVYRKFFGKFASVMSWGAMILLALSVIFALCLPEHPWIAVTVYVAALIYHLGTEYLVHSEMKKSGNPGL